MSEFQDSDLREIQSLLSDYFPFSRISESDSVFRLEDDSPLLTQKKQILSYLQTAFFEEHLLEVQILKTTRIFFSMIVDELPPLEEKVEDGEIVFVACDYEPGSYLKKEESFLLTPLTPGVGNVTIRQLKQAIIRFFIGTTAVELGCIFYSTDEVRGRPVLRMEFPRIGRINKGFRSYRVKIVASVEAKVFLLEKKYAHVEKEACQIVDISPYGLGFSIKKGSLPLQVGEELHICIKISGMKDIHVRGSVRRFTNVYGSNGANFICGLQYDLETCALATDLERLAAAAQRFQLRELAGITADLTGVRLIR